MRTHMPKIQKMVDKKKGKEYPRYSINIPKWIMESRNWDENTKLGFVIEENRVHLKELKKKVDT